MSDVIFTAMQGHQNPNQTKSLNGVLGLLNLLNGTIGLLNLLNGTIGLLNFWFDLVGHVG